MEKYYKNIIGTAVFQDDAQRPISTIKDLVIDPESGKIIAIVIDINKNLVISPVDIIKWGAVLKTHNHDTIVAGNEILRVEQVQNSDIKIMGNKVETQSKEDLGMVIDYAIDTKTYELRKIVTAKGFLGLFRYDSRLIPSSEIVEIKKNKIIVKKSKSIQKEKSKISIKEPAPV